VDELTAERAWYSHVARAVARQDASDISARNERPSGADAFASAALAGHRRTRGDAAELHAALPNEHFIGRTDHADGTALYIGRRLVRDEIADRPESHLHVADGLAVINWQVPAAKPFYTARPGATGGVVRRRRYTFADGTVERFTDEELGSQPRQGAAAKPNSALRREAPPRTPTAEQQALSSSPHVDDTLLADLARSRDQHMHDIVATIQAEQYELMERPAAGVLVVQGGPGTGKTAVALHRLSLLLVRDDRLKQSGTLLIGPSTRFLDYIARVLPGLGDDAVDQRTVATLTRRRVTDEPESVEVARVKGSTRMLDVLRRSVDLLVRVPDRPFVVELG